jgi:hypothetical protein
MPLDHRSPLLTSPESLDVLDDGLHNGVGGGATPTVTSYCMWITGIAFFMRGYPLVDVRGHDEKECNSKTANDASTPPLSVLPIFSVTVARTVTKVRCGHVTKKARHTSTSIESKKQQNGAKHVFRTTQLTPFAGRKLKVLRRDNLRSSDNTPVFINAHGIPCSALSYFGVGSSSAILASFLLWCPNIKIRKIFGKLFVRHVG